MAELSVSMGLLVLVLTFVVGLFGAATGLPAQHERGLHASQAAAAVLRHHTNLPPTAAPPLLPRSLGATTQNFSISWISALPPKTQPT